MKVIDVLITARQPIWLRALLTVAVSLASVACSDHQYQFQTLVASFIAYHLLIGIPWLIIRSRPPEHPWQKAQTAAPEAFSMFWLGICMLVANLVVHGLPDSRRDYGVLWACGWFLSGAFQMVLSRTAHARR